MDDVVLIRYYTDLPVIDEKGAWEADGLFDAHMRAWDSAAAVLTQRGDMLVWTCGFADIVMLAREHGWRSQLVDAVMWDEDHTNPFRVGDRSAYEFSVALRTALDEGDDDGEADRIRDLIAFCERGGFDVA